MSFESTILDAFIVSERPSVIAGALRFDKAKSQYAEIPHNIAYSSLTAMTVSIWIRPESAVVTGHPVYLEKDFGTSQSFGIYQDPSGYFHVGIDTTSHGWGAYNAMIPTLNRWYMVTAVYTGSDFRVFINGEYKGGFARSGTVEMSGDPWRLAYRQNTGAYMSMSAAEFKMWNYALTDAEVAELYVPTNVCGYTPAYLHASPLIGGISSAASSHIVSEVSLSNPLELSSSIGACIATDAISPSVACYISSGVTESRDFDNVVDIANRSDRLFDNIVIISGGRTGFTEILKGRVMYPITRDHAEEYRIITRSNPGKKNIYCDAYIKTFDHIKSNVAAFIRAGDPIRKTVMAYIGSGILPISGSKSAHISGPAASSRYAYLQGRVQPVAAATKSAFLNADNIPSTTQSKSAHLVGPGPTSNIECYVHASTPVYKPVSAYLHSDPVFTHTHTRYSYIYGSGTINRSRPAFIDGVFWQYGTKHAFIPVLPFTTGSTQAFIQSPNAHRSWSLAFIYGNQPTPVTKLCYLKSERFVVEPHSSFVHGAGQRSSERGLYINGIVDRPVLSHNMFVSGHLIGQTPPQPAFISNTGMLTGAAAYISGPNENTQTCAAYLVAPSTIGSSALGHIVGDNEFYQPIHVAGHSVSSDTTELYVHNVGTKWSAISAWVAGDPLVTFRNCFIIA